MKVSQGLVVDNFAGGGGASTGIEMAIGRSVDIAINHDPDAIAMHRVNHPHTKHYTEDIWDVDPVEVCDGQSVSLAWFSPDCKHFSKAKGGKPVNKHIRGLTWVAVKWGYLVAPKCIMLENVPEIRSWGPLGTNDLPIKDRAGETFNGFIDIMTDGIDRNHPAFREMCDALDILPDSEAALQISQGLGYSVEYRVLKSCDYGAPTTRQRLYLIARKDGCEIVWPEPGFAPKDSPEVRSGQKDPYRSIAECIDWTIPVKSIFERKKPLAENTLRRIARGIKKFVIENPEPYIVREKSAAQMPFLIQYHSETSGKEVRGQEVDQPLMTLDTSNRYALACANIMKNYAGGYKGSGSAVQNPLDTITAVDHNSLVLSYIVHLRKNQDGQATDEPLTTISCSGAHHAEVRAFLIKYFSNGTAKSVDSPLDTITTRDRFALITVHGEEYILTDIGMRMLQPRELFNAQGFPEDYVIDRDADGKVYPKSKQVARCGNAVTPPVPAALVRANLPELCMTRRGEKNDSLQQGRGG